MITALVALGAFVIGVGVTVAVSVFWFRLGVQLGRDERALDPGPVTGSLEAVAEAAAVLPASTLVRSVGESSGPRHAMPTALEVTDRFEPVRAVICDAATRYQENPDE